MDKINFFYYSAMPPSLGSMTSTCLQQRDGYPYVNMFTDPLHSLGNPYNTHSSRSTPTAAHQQPTSQHFSSNSTSTTSTGKTV